VVDVVVHSPPTTASYSRWPCSGGSRSRSSGRYQDEHPLLLKSCRMRRGALDGLLGPGSPGVSSSCPPSAFCCPPPPPFSLLMFSSALFTQPRRIGEHGALSPRRRRGGESLTRPCVHVCPPLCQPHASSGWAACGWAVAAPRHVVCVAHEHRPATAPVLARIAGL